MEKSKIIKYAELIAKVGANIQKGQEVNLVADIEIKDFILILIEECYKAGASKVNIDWTDDELTKLNIKYADEEKLSHLTSYEKAKQEYNIENLVSDKRKMRYDVVGPVCESSDKFDSNVMLPQTKRGDLIAINTAGAYGQVMAMRYNQRDLAKAYYSDELCRK